MKIFTKESVLFITVAFIIWIILEIIFDMISGVTLNEMMTTRYVAGTLISAVVFAILLLLFELWRNRKK
ncbi:MAG: hypothetical protein IKV80_03785 [Bacteroidales bacterium]|nr:hypothetical protein [Bacteroidales bacterium]